MTLVGAAHSAAVDLIAGTVVHAGPDGDSVARHPRERDEVLADMHRALLEGDDDVRLCSLEQGMAVVRLIDAIERSVRVGGWVERGPTR